MDEVLADCQTDWKTSGSNELCRFVMWDITPQQRGHYLPFLNVFRRSKTEAKHCVKTDKVVLKMRMMSPLCLVNFYQYIYTQLCSDAGGSLSRLSCHHVQSVPLSLRSVCTCIFHDQKSKHYSNNRYRL